jgi:hypothetical protein
VSAGTRSIRVARPAPPVEQPPRLAITRVATMLLALAVVLSLALPMAAFAAVRNWSLTRSPASVSGGTSVVSLTATNTGDDGGGEAVGCVLIVIPNASFTVSGVSIVAVGDSGDSWSATFVVGPSDTNRRGVGRDLHVDRQRLQQGGLHRRLRHAAVGERHDRRCPEQCRARRH